MAVSPDSLTGSEEGESASYSWFFFLLWYGNSFCVISFRPPAIRV